MEHHLICRIMHTGLPSDASECTLHLMADLNVSQTDLVLDLLTLNGWKAELTLVVVYMPKWLS